MRRPCASAAAAVLLLALPPLLGTGGRAHAGFAGVSLDGHAAVEAPRWAVLAQGFLAAPDLTMKPAAVAVPADEPPRPVPGPGPREHANPTDGATTGTGPTEPDGPSGSPPNLNGRRPALSLPRAGLLRLADATLRPDPRASRLFRPPRS